MTNWSVESWGQCIQQILALQWNNSLRLEIKVAFECGFSLGQSCSTPSSDCPQSRLQLSFSLDASPSVILKH